MASSFFHSAADGDWKLDVKAGRRCRVGKNHNILTLAECCRWQVFRVKQLLKLLGITESFLKAAKHAIEFNPIMQSSDFQLARFAYQALANQAIKSGWTQAD